MGAMFQKAAASALVLAAAAAAAAAQAEPMTSAARELEVRVWTADDQDLSYLEQDVVRVIQRQPDSAAAHQLLSHVLVRIFSRDPGDLFILKQASDMAQQALDLDPQSDAGYVAVAEILDLMGNADRGLSLLTEAENLGVKPTWRFAFTRSRLLSDEIKTTNVLGELEKALSFPDSEPRIVAPYVLALLGTEKHGEALLTAVQNWNKRFPTELFQMTMATLNAELGNNKRASELYAAIEKANPNSREAKVNHGILLYRDLKDPKPAIKLFADVLMKDRAILPKQTTATIFAHLGAAELALKNYREAEGAFVQALATDQGNLSIVDFATRTYREKKLHRELVSLMRRVVNDVSGSGVMYALIGETLSEQLADHDRALKAFKDAITLDPDRSDYYNGLGLVYYRKKSYPEALRTFAAASEVDPNDATARYNHACVLSLMGRGEEAMASLTEALTLDPRLATNAKNDTDFSELRPSMKFQQLVASPPPAKEDTPYDLVPGDSTIAH